MPFGTQVVVEFDRRHRLLSPSFHLHYQASQVAIAFFTDMHLPVRCSPSCGVQDVVPGKTQRLDSAESMRIINCKHERECDKRSDAIDLF